MMRWWADDGVSEMPGEGGAFHDDDNNNNNDENTIQQNQQFVPCLDLASVCTFPYSACTWLDCGVAYERVIDQGVLLIARAFERIKVQENTRNSTQNGVCNTKAIRTGLGIAESTSDQTSTMQPVFIVANICNGIFTPNATGQHKNQCRTSSISICRFNTHDINTRLAQLALFLSPSLACVTHTNEWLTFICRCWLNCGFFLINFGLNGFFLFHFLLWQKKWHKIFVKKSHVCTDGNN